MNGLDLTQPGARAAHQDGAGEGDDADGGDDIRKRKVSSTMQHAQEENRRLIEGGQLGKSRDRKHDVQEALREKAASDYSAVGGWVWACKVCMCFVYEFCVCVCMSVFVCVVCATCDGCACVHVCMCTCAFACVCICVRVKLYL